MQFITREMQLLSLFLQELQQSGREKRPCRRRSFTKAMSARSLGSRKSSGQSCCRSSAADLVAMPRSEAPTSRTPSTSTPEVLSSSTTPRTISFWSWQCSAWHMNLSAGAACIGQTRAQTRPRPALATASPLSSTTEAVDWITSPVCRAREGIY